MSTPSELWLHEPTTPKQQRVAHAYPHNSNISLCGKTKAKHNTPTNTSHLCPTCLDETQRKHHFLR